MKVAVCNKNINLLKSVKLMIYRYAEINGIEIFAECYISGEDMLASGKNYNIIFLDYNLVGANGLEIAKAVRLYNSKCSIIFTSSHTRFIFDAFKVSASSFLINPVEENEVFTVLEEYFEKKGNDYPLLIKSGADTICLNTGEIVYIEANNKHCILHLKNESYNCNRTMARVFDVMPKNHFLKINRAFVINSDYINKYNNEAVYMKNGKKLYISRTYLKNFKSDYKNLVNPLQP